VFCPCSSGLVVELQVGLGGLWWKGITDGCCTCDILLCHKTVECTSIKREAARCFIEVKIII